MPKYSMNLDEQYVDNWGAWEIVRELVCNAKDADPAFILNTPSPDKIEIITSSIPTMEELMIIGAGTSRQDSDKIGQFGEGFKMAALVTTRSNGQLMCQSPLGRMTFSLDKPSPNYPSRVLYAHLDKRYKTRDKCIVSLTLPGAAKEIDGKFLKTQSALLGKPELSPCKVYVKGVYTTTLDSLSVFDWNLKTSPLNRDRSMVSSSNVKYEIATILYHQSTHPTSDYEAVMRHPKCFELEVLRSIYSMNQLVRDKVKEAFHNVFGSRAVIATDNMHKNELAMLKGYEVISITDELKMAEIPTAESVLSTSDTFTETKVPQKFYDEVEWVLDMLDVPAQVKFYEEPTYETDGRATIEKGVAIVWINAALTVPGKRMERFATIIHEVCHVSSKANDGSVVFEYAQNELGAKLLDKLHVMTRR